MRDPLSFYIELVDGAAFDQAEQGTPVTQFDLPAAPLIFPWAIGGPALAILGPTSEWSFAVFTVTMAASIACWSAFGWFYYRRVKAHRTKLGIEVKNPPGSFVWAILIAVALTMGLAFWLYK